MKFMHDNTMTSTIHLFRWLGNPARLRPPHWFGGWIGGSTGWAGLNTDHVLCVFPTSTNTTTPYKFSGIIEIGPPLSFSAILWALENVYGGGC